MWFLAFISMLCAIDVAIVAIVAMTENIRREVCLERSERAASAIVRGLQDFSSYRS